MLIRSLQSVVPRELALRRLSPSGVAGFLRRRTTGKLIGVAEIYMPYRLYKITVNDRGVQATHFLGIDVLTGKLDPFEFTGPDIKDRSVEIETRNHLPLRLPQSEAQAIALAKTRRAMFSRGFFRLAQPSICIETIDSEFYVPYWVGFYGNENNIKVLAIDATRATLEGGKVTECIKSWLAAEPSAKTLTTQRV